MKIHFLGCRASSEAIPKYKHTSFVIEINDVLYWFDAGEGCSSTAHRMGMNLLKIKEIFISHPHMDHVGGLGNLLWTMRKLSESRKQLPVYGNIGLHISDLLTWEGLWKLLKNTEDNFAWECKVIPAQITEGEIYRDKNLSVCAVHNGHMAQKETDIWLSFSFEICCEEKRIVYSGDIKGLSDLDELLECPCDYLLIENSHQSIEEICEYANQKKIGTVVFLHHRRDVMENMAEARSKAQKLARCKVLFARDGDTLRIPGIKVE